MKVKNDHIKINCEVCNVPSITFNFHKDIWESESIVDDLDFYVPEEVGIYIWKPFRYRKSRK
tara:strand:- start:1750 stop:1935 length:186 start_codon:yes stop_codon:yes gene_type:complete